MSEYASDNEPVVEVDGTHATGGSPVDLYALDCPSAALVDEVVACHREVGQAQARLLRALRALAAQGHFPPRQTRSGRQMPHGFCGVEVAAALTWSQYAADHALALSDLAIVICPTLINCLRDGSLDWTKLRMLGQELGEVDSRHLGAVIGALRPEFDRCTVGQLRERLRRLILEVDPGPARQRHAASVAKRRVQHMEYASCTSALGAVYLPVEKAAAAWNNVDRIAKAAHAAGDPHGRGIDQIRADVFADLLAGVRRVDATGAPAAAKSVVNLHIDLTTLACLKDNPAIIPGFGAVPADIARQTVRQVAEHAQWRFTVTEEAAVIAEGRLRHRPTPAQRAFIVARDVTCRAPGCRRPARGCDIDHIADWAKGGTTTVRNLCSLCELHHQAKHAGGFKVRRTSRGIEWTTPLGVRYVVLSGEGTAPDDAGLAAAGTRRAQASTPRFRR